MEKVELGRTRSPADGCRRYRPVSYTFDTRARYLETSTSDFDPEIAKQWEDNKAQIRQQLAFEFGPADHQRKVADFIAIEAAPFSVVARHNLFLNHARISFVAGAYYGALVASSALGERILNQLIITMRVDYPKDSAFYFKSSFQDWPAAIKILKNWGVVEESTAKAFGELNILRNKAVHYYPKLDTSDARSDALEAIRLIQQVIQDLFTPIAGPPTGGLRRFIADTPGHGFIALEREGDPLIKHFYIPASALVSPKHQWIGPPESVEILDDETYQDRFSELTDEEFASHLSDPK